PSLAPGRGSSSLPPGAMAAGPALLGPGLAALSGGGAFPAGARLAPGDASGSGPPAPVARGPGGTHPEPARGRLATGGRDPRPAPPGGELLPARAHGRRGPARRARPARSRSAPAGPVREGRP